jgi:hypothetical protein
MSEITTDNTSQDISPQDTSPQTTVLDNGSGVYFGNTSFVFEIAHIVMAIIFIILIALCFTCDSVSTNSGLAVFLITLIANYGLLIMALIIVIILRVTNSVTNILSLNKLMTTYYILTILMMTPSLYFFIKYTVCPYADLILFLLTLLAYVVIAVTALTLIVTGLSMFFTKLNECLVGRMNKKDDYVKTNDENL